MPSSKTESNDTVRMVNPIREDDGASSPPKTDDTVLNPDNDADAAQKKKWAAHRKAKLTGRDSVLPEIMINGEIQKVSQREHSKWNETGASKLDDRTFKKHDDEVCESRLARQRARPACQVHCEARATL